MIADIVKDYYAALAKAAHKEAVVPRAVGTIKNKASLHAKKSKTITKKSIHKKSKSKKRSNVSSKRTKSAATSVHKKRTKKKAVMRAKSKIKKNKIVKKVISQKIKKGLKHPNSKSTAIINGKKKVKGKKKK